MEPLTNGLMAERRLTGGTFEQWVTVEGRLTVEPLNNGLMAEGRLTGGTFSLMGLLTGRAFDKWGL